MRLIKYILIITTFFLMNTAAHSAVFSFEDEPDTGVAVFPSGTMFKATLQNTVSSKESQVGDAVSFVLDSDMVIGRAVCIPKGSIFLGRVVEMEQPQQGRDGYFRIGIHELVFVDGWRVDVAARVLDNVKTDIIGGGVTPRQEYKKVPHYIQDIGPVIKLVKTGPREMGQNRALPAGKKLILVLDRPLEVKYLQDF